MSNNITKMKERASECERGREGERKRYVYIDKPKTSYQFIVYRYFFDAMRPKQYLQNSNWNFTHRFWLYHEILMHIRTQIHIWLFPPRFFQHTQCTVYTHCDFVRHAHSTYIHTHSHNFTSFFHWKLISMLLCINHTIWTILHTKMLFFLLPPPVAVNYAVFVEEKSEEKLEKNVKMYEWGKKTRRPYALDYIVNAELNKRTNKIHVEFFFVIVKLMCVRICVYTTCSYQCQGDVRKSRRKEKAKCVWYNNRYDISHFFFKLLYRRKKIWFTEKGDRNRLKMS